MGLYVKIQLLPHGVVREELWYNAVLFKFEECVKLFLFYSLVFYWGKTLTCDLSGLKPPKFRPSRLRIFSLQNSHSFSKNKFSSPILRFLTNFEAKSVKI